MEKKHIIALVASLSLIIAHAVLCFWLAGVYFLRFAGMEELFADTTSANFSTWSEYKAAYGTEPRVKKLLGAAALAAGGTFFVPLILIAALALTPSKRALYGSSRLAKRQEAYKALSAPVGILCGKLGNKYLCFGGTQHALMEAPSRSGKGVGVVIPNLLSFTDSVVVLDIKQENWNLTSGYLAKHGHKCFLFNPACADYRTHRWNPLGYVSKDIHFRIDDIQKIGAMLLPHDGKSDPFWIDAPRSIFLGICLYLMDTPELPFTLGEVYRQSMRLNNRLYFQELAKARQKTGNPLHPQALLSFQGFAGLSENTAGSVGGTLQARLSLWANPVVDAATATNDFDLRNLRRERMSVYLGITPDNLERLAFVVNLFFNQCFDLNTRELPENDKTLKLKTLFLMDEFTAIGKLPIIEKGIAYFAGYNLRLLIIIQSVAQLTALYGEASKDTFVTNLALRIVFAPKENKVAQEISESLGYITESNVSKSKSRAFGKSGGSRSESESAVKRALFWPHELREIGKERAILIVDEVRPVICKKIRYYKDKNFTARLLPAPSVPLVTLGSAANENIEDPAVENILQKSGQTPDIQTGEENSVFLMENTISQVTPKIEIVEEIVAVTTIEQVNRLNLSNVRFVNKNVIIPKPATLDDDPESFAEEFADALFAV